MTTTPGNALNISSTTSGLVNWDGSKVISSVSPTNHAIMVGTGSNTITSITAGTTGQILQANTSADPSYSTATYPSASGSAGKILRSDGTNNVYTTATYPATTTANQILYSSADNTVAGLATANTAVLATNNSGVPSITATPQITGLGIGATSTGSGLTFDGSNTLSIFSQGTFSPTIAGDGTAGTTTYSIQIGRYQKVGRVVTIQMRVDWSGQTGTGNTVIGGLPFTTLNVSFTAPNFYFSSLGSQTTTFNNVYPIFYGNANVSTIPQIYSATLSTGTYTQRAITTTGSFILSGSYETT